jgi:site-specific DNA-methyltransferase (adenine-specific)
MKCIPDDSTGALITDPPFSIGIADWDSFNRIDEFMIECKRVLKPNGFLAFFAQMPTMIDWLNSASTHFNYLEHICWVKRNITPAHRLSRTFENIFIYGIKNKNFYNVKGRYSDVRVPGLMFEVVDIHGIQRYIDALWDVIKGGSNVKKRPRITSRPYLNKDAKYASETVNYTNVWSFARENVRHSKDYHPTVKPIKLMERLVMLLSQENDIILDPFVGSGSTLVAAKKLGRRWIGCDLSQEYIDIAQKRLDEIDAVQLEVRCEGMFQGSP